jgi:chromosome segregation ATPase
MNDIKTVLTILLKNNMEQKEAVITLTQSIKELEEERDELEGALTRTVEYTKNLEEEIIEITGDPECLRQIGEDTEMCMELESHKKALKGLTSQYNQLEHKMDDVSRKYEDLKKNYEEKCRKLQELEKNKGN